MDPKDKLILRSALKSLRELGERGATPRILRDLVEADTDIILSDGQSDALRVALTDRQYARTFYAPVTKELRLAITQRGIDAEHAL